MGHCLTRAWMRVCGCALGGVMAAAVTFGAPAIAHADTPQANPMYAVAIATGQAADQLQQEMANQSQALSAAALGLGYPF